MEPEREETARGRTGEAALELWKKESFPGWEEARGRSAMVGSCQRGVAALRAQVWLVAAD